MERRGYSIIKAADLILRLWLGKLSKEERDEYERMKQGTGLERKAEWLEDRNKIAVELQKMSCFNPDMAYSQFRGLTVGARRREKRLFRLKVVASLLLPFLVGGALWYALYPDPATEKVEKTIIAVSSRATIILADGMQVNLEEGMDSISEKDGTLIRHEAGRLIYDSREGHSKAIAIYNELAVPRGGEYMLALSDGTKIWLNADSRLRFPVHFNGESRDVFLSGEAYFEVKRDTARPFVVHTSLGNVNVLGTEFNVRDYKEEQKVVTTLVNGSVYYYNSGVSEDGVVLNPGFQVIAAKGRGLTMCKVDVREFAGWKDGIYVFNKQPLGEMMRTVERNYDVEVLFQEETLKKLRFTGTLKKYGRLEQFLQFIETGGDVIFTVEGRTILVGPK